MIWKTWVLGLAAVLLTGCAIPYHHDAGFGGYNDSPIEKNLYRAVYTSPGGLNVQTVRDLALLRAAEVMERHGYPYFVVVRENSGMTARVQPGAAVPYAAPPLWVSDATGPHPIYVNPSGGVYGEPPAAPMPMPYTELFIRGYETKPQLPESTTEKKEIESTSDILRRVQTQYKLTR